MLRKQQFEETAFNPSTYEMLFIHYIFIESLLHVRHCDSQVASFGPFPQLLHRSLPRRLTGMDYTNGLPCSLAFSAIWPLRVLARDQIERKKGGQVPIHRPMVPPKAVFFSQFSLLRCGRITLLNSLGFSSDNSTDAPPRFLHYPVVPKHPKPPLSKE